MNLEKCTQKQRLRFLRNQKVYNDYVAMEKEGYAKTRALEIIAERYNLKSIQAVYACMKSYNKNK